MTNTTLERAQEIKEEIHVLRYALGETSEKKLFTSDNRASCTGRLAMPFLSALDAELRTKAVKAITDKITTLEKEFKAL